MEPSASGRQTTRLTSAVSKLVLHRPERVDVEVDRPDELDQARPPVGGRALGADQLQQGGTGEEDRADEEDNAIGRRPDQVHEARKRADEEAERADREQDPDPPGEATRGPEARPVLAIGAVGHRRSLGIAAEPRCRGPRSAYVKMFTARAITRPRMTSEIIAWVAMAILA